MQYKLLDPDDRHTGTFDCQITCRLCKLKGNGETPFHLATQYLRAWRARWDYLGCYSMESEEIPNWEPTGLLQFFKHFNLENKPNSL